MTKKEIFAEPIWMPRLIFTANLLYRKKWKDCDEEEQLMVRAQILGITKIEDHEN